MEKDLTSNSALRWTRLAGKPGFTAVRLARGAGAAAASLQSLLVAIPWHLLSEDEMVPPAIAWDQAWLPKR